MSAGNVSSLAPGTLFRGAYEVVRCIRSGGMGAVYEVVHKETRRRRALKLMLPETLSSPELRARFRLEATVAADIQSDHIVETFDAGVDGETGAPFLVMELLRGEDLADALKKRGALPAAEVVVLLHQVALALDKTHAAGVVHRDLKPENLFVTRSDDGSPRMKILDFGIAKVLEQGSASTTQVVGTPLYMAPEQIERTTEIGPRTDLYALGQIAFTLLVGSAYWEEKDDGVFALLRRIVAGATETASARAARKGVGLPPMFDVWFVKATAVSPALRFDGAAAMVDALAEALETPPPTLAVAPRSVRRSDIVDEQRDPYARTVASRGMSSSDQPTVASGAVSKEATTLAAPVVAGTSEGERTGAPLSSTTRPVLPRASALRRFGVPAAVVLVAAVGVAVFYAQRQRDAPAAGPVEPEARPTVQAAATPSAETHATPVTEAAPAEAPSPEAEPAPSATSSAATTPSARPKPRPAQPSTAPTSKPPPADVDPLRTR